MNYYILIKMCLPSIIFIRCACKIILQVEVYGPFSGLSDWHVNTNAMTWVTACFFIKFLNLFIYFQYQVTVWPGAHVCHFSLIFYYHQVTVCHFNLLLIKKVIIPVKKILNKETMLHLFFFTLIFMLWEVAYIFASLEIKPI